MAVVNARPVRHGYGDVSMVKSVAGVSQDALTAIESSVIASYPFRSGLSDATLTRSGTATYIDPVTGLVTDASANAGRFEAEGLLLEESRTNLALYSEDPDNWLAAGGVTATKNAVTAPDGTTTGTALLVTDISVVSLKAPLFTPAGTTEHAHSVWVKGVGSSIGKVLDLAPFDAVTSLPVAAATTTLTSEWQRVSVSGTCATTNQHYLLAGFVAGGSSDLEVGDTFYIWGYQSEEGIGVSSYIRTTGSSVTRSKDVLEVPTSAMPAYASDMSIAMTFRLKSDPNGYHGLWSATGENAREGDVDNGTGKLIHFVPSTDASTGASLSHSADTKYAFTYDADGNWIAYLNGTQDDTAAVGAISGTMTNLYVGVSDGGVYPLHGWIKDVQVFDRVLTATEVGLL